MNRALTPALLLLAATGFGQTDPVKEALQLVKEYRYEEAFPLLQEGIQKNPERADLYYYLTLCAIHLERWEDAKKAAQEALQRGFSPPRAYAIQAHVMAGIGQFKKAQEALQAARDRLPPPEESQDEPEKRSPEEVEVDFITGVVSVLQKQYDRGVQILKDVLKHTPQNAYVHYYLGMAYYYLRKKSTAIEYLNNFVDLAPEAPETPRVRELLRRLQGG